MEADEEMICRKCCDLPHRRPLDKPCKCGEVYAPEGIAFDPGDRAAGAWAMSMTDYALNGYVKKDHEATSPWSPRYCGPPEKQGSTVEQLNQESFLI